MQSCLYVLFFFFFNDPATTEIYTLSLHDALPIYHHVGPRGDLPRAHARARRRRRRGPGRPAALLHDGTGRSEEHTSELQSHSDLVCRLLLEKKNKTDTRRQTTQSTMNSNSNITNY